MRLLLDAHVSSRHLGQPLRQKGHEVLAIDQDDALRKLSDEAVMTLGAEQRRIVITHNVRHFVPIVRHWVDRDRRHQGLILVTLLHADYGAILRRLEQLFTKHPGQDDWIDRVAFLSRG